MENHAKDPRHMIMSASQYGNPENKGCVVNQLDVMILGAFEVDTDFNLNVITGSNGVIMSASGGNPDTAAGSKISVVVSSLMKKGPRCLIKKAVTTVATPGETVDAVVTDKGIAINPRRTDLLAALKDSDLPLVDIRDLAEMGETLGGIEDHPDFTNRIVAVAEYRDGTVIDVVRQVRTN
ncbi:MAG: citrate lyase subunit alpha [Oscillospiraceae bacterium]|nr:citrate lyase subunit alpha [Oscillospiraceae bacterium]MDY5736554.1 citrate lyase subunit alpha [Oscillospiraceae bacterium]